MDYWYNLLDNQFDIQRNAASTTQQTTTTIEQQTSSNNIANTNNYQ